MSHWDVCLLPFALNEATRFISPTKTLEYLAAGKPVVSTPIRDVVSLYGAAVRIGMATANEFVRCHRGRTLSRVAVERAELAQSRAQALVDGCTWDGTADDIAEPAAAEYAPAREVLPRQPTVAHEPFYESPGFGASSRCRDSGGAPR